MAMLVTADLALVLQRSRWCDTDVIPAISLDPTRALGTEKHRQASSSQDLSQGPRLVAQW